MTTTVLAETVSVRLAEEHDVAAIVAMLADDPLGGQREDPAALDGYLAAFRRIDGDGRNILAVAETADGRVIGCLQLIVMPGLSYRGAERAQIEDVRVDASLRGLGIGKRLMDWACEEAARRGCTLVQLFTHESRSAARRFYKTYGFQDQHVGMRMKLDGAP